MVCFCQIVPSTFGYKKIIACAENRISTAIKLLLHP